VNITELLILGLATWRVSSLLAEEEGPRGVLERMRYKIGVRYDEESYAYGTNELARQVL
jgi:hypothetical protein